MKQVMVFFAMCFVSLSALAQQNRSFVSTTGSDFNACTPGNECRSFTRAIAVTNPGGEIIAISSGGYGPFTISGAISVMGAPGVAAEITSSAADGVTIGAGSTDRVILRGLNITITGSFDGIRATGFGNLSIANCTVNGGVESMSVQGPSGSTAVIADSVVRGPSDSGFIFTSRGVVVRCRAENANVSGLAAVDGPVVDGTVSAVDYVGVGCLFGAYARSFTAGHIAVLDLDRALLSHNTYGVEADNLSSVVVSSSMATENLQYGFNQLGTSFLYTPGNNVVAGNGNLDLHGSQTPLTLH